MPATLADYPHLVAQLHPRRNGRVDPATIAHGTDRKLWWRCPEGRDHLWLARVRGRTMHGDGCPFCAGHAVSVINALPTVAPAVARQWHPTLNGDLRPRDVVARSGRRVWWKCPMGSDHVWCAAIGERVGRGTRCPFCARSRPSAARNLAVVASHLIAEWHPIRNGALRPEDVAPGSTRKKVWWRCAVAPATTSGPRPRPGAPRARAARSAPATS